MTVKIDKADRIAPPKPIPERFHLREGVDLELEERPDGLTRRPIEKRPSMVRKSGIRVHFGEVSRGFDWDDAEERIKDAWYFDTAVIVAESVSDHPHRG